MRVAALLLSSLALAGPASAAEDFSGFYAGVNAGYGFHPAKREARARGAVTGAGERAAAEIGLPPSARDAAEAMRAERRQRGR